MSEMSYTPYTPLKPVEEDPFAGRYAKWTQLALGFMKPSSTEPPFVLLQMLFETSPQVFTLISPLHSNDENDVLHYSLLVKTPYRSATVHINGFWKNDFKITGVSMITSDNVSGKVDCGIIATFVKN
jgi:hypothetical protein